MLEPFSYQLVYLYLKLYISFWNFMMVYCFVQRKRICIRVERFFQKTVAYLSEKALLVQLTLKRCITVPVLKILSHYVVFIVELYKICWIRTMNTQNNCMPSFQLYVHLCRACRSKGLEAKTWGKNSTKSREKIKSSLCDFHFQLE